MLQALLTRRDIQDQFTRILFDYANHAFAPDNVEKTVGIIYSMMQNEITHNVSAFGSPNAIEDYIADILYFANERFQYIVEDMLDLFDYSGDMYHISMKGAEGATALLNTIRLEGGQSVEGYYFVEHELVLSAEPDFGYEFDYWLVNGTKYTDQTIFLDVSYGVEISAELAVRPKDFTHLIVNEVYYSGGADWIELYNPTDRSISTRGYYLSDNIEDLRKYPMKSYTIPAGGYLLVVCKDNRTRDALMRPQTNFNLKIGETLFLSDFRDNMASSVYLDAVRSDQALALDHRDGLYKKTTVSTPESENAISAYEGGK